MDLNVLRFISQVWLADEESAEHAQSKVVALVVP